MFSLSNYFSSLAVPTLSFRAGSTFQLSGGITHLISNGAYHGLFNENTLDYDIGVLRVCTYTFFRIIVNVVARHKRHCMHLVDQKERDFLNEM